MVSDLHRLVTFAAPQERPLLLVGSELGALVVRAFAHLHPQVCFTREAVLRIRDGFCTDPDPRFLAAD
jgi:hypothetical protein